MSIVFRGLMWRDIEGVRMCVKGELPACDLVSVASNSGARILSMRSARTRPIVSLAGWSRMRCCSPRGASWLRLSGYRPRRIAVARLAARWIGWCANCSRPVQPTK